MPILLLLRASALLTLDPTLTQVDFPSLLPGALMSFEPLVFRWPQQACSLLVKSRVSSGIAQADDAARTVIAECRNPRSLFVMEGQLDSTIEGAGGHFFVQSEGKEEERVVIAITAKLRIPGNDTPRGADLVRGAQEKLGVPGLGVLAVSCYEEDDDSIPLSSRSIVLGVREIKALLKPFGVSYMLGVW